MALLAWGDVVSIPYTGGDTAVTLTGEQLSVIVQMIALFNSPSAWSDYDVYHDEIEAMVADLVALTTGGL